MAKSAKRQAKKVAKTAKRQAKKVAKTGAKQVGNVVAEALGAAAATAAGVVLTRVAEGMSSGAKKVEEKTPAVKNAAKQTAKHQRLRGKLLREKRRRQRSAARGVVELELGVLRCTYASSPALRRGYLRLAPENGLACGSSPIDTPGLLTPQVVMQ